jgi:cysteine desulfurase/selenocysteine lyase
LDITALRNETPGVNEVIHFNNAGASLITQKTLDAQLGYLKEEALFGGYETAAKYEKRINAFYTEIAKLLNAEPKEIAYTESATVAWERAFFSIDFKPGDEIICDHTSYASNYIAHLQAEQRYGTKTVVIPANDFGEVDVEALKTLISAKTKLISITHMPTNGGLVNPAEAIGRVANEHHILYLLDACQSAGQYPLDVKRIGCDFLSSTGRKYLRGPRGTGFLYASKKILKSVTPLNLDLHSAEWNSINSFKQLDNAKKFETWESNIAAKIGLMTAVQQINEIGIDKICNRVTEVADCLRDELSKIKEITVQDIGRVKSGIVTFTSSKFTPLEMKKYFSENKINTVTPTLNGTRIDMEARKLDAVLRSSVHYYNTKEEIDTFASLIKQMHS